MCGGAQICVSFESGVIGVALRGGGKERKALSLSLAFEQYIEFNLGVCIYLLFFLAFFLCAQIRAYGFALALVGDGRQDPKRMEEFARSHTR